MQGPVAAAATLAAYGRVRLAETTPGAWPAIEALPAFRFVGAVEFVAHGTGASVHASVEAWLRWLATRGCRQLWLLHEASPGGPSFDVRTAGLAGGGGRWSVMAIDGAGRARPWTARWEVGAPHADDRRIWKATFVEGDMREAIVPADDVAASATALAAALDRLEAFCASERLGGFLPPIDRARGLLAGAPLDAEDAAWRDVLDRRGARLRAAVRAAWVFGGMGSWNDQTFAGAAAARFEAATIQHWEACTSALVAAANSGAALGGAGRAH